MNVSRILKLIAAPLCGYAVGAFGGETKTLSYDEDVRPILKAHCFKCHGEDEKKDGLSLATYAELVKGGSAGDIVKAGRSSASVLYLALAHQGDDIAPMPPKQLKINDAEIAMVKLWIDQGIVEKAGGKSAVPPKRDMEFKSVAIGKPEGPPPMPQNLPAITATTLKRPHPVTAMACSPWAPLLAVAGHEQIKIYDTEKKTLIGALPFAEGIPYVLRFSRNGSVLLAAGGRGVQTGKAVLYDVKSGKRLGEFGDETDIVLAADISADQKLVALGGPGKIVKVFSTADGKMLYKITKHTDWITALEFSPDGSKLATADRNGGVHLWEALGGGILYSLSEHKEGVNAMSWRGDGQLLATGGEDGQLIFWDVKEGWPMSSSSPHVPKAKPKVFGKQPGGVLSVQFSSTGQCYTIGRDNAVRSWSSEGQRVGGFDGLVLLPTRVATNFDGKSVFIGDAQGGIQRWDGTAAPEAFAKN